MRTRRIGLEIESGIGLGIRLWIGLAIALAVTTGCSKPEVPLAVGQPVPDFSVQLADGGKVTKLDLAGLPAVISFWATWCQPCYKEIPVLNQLEAEGRAHVLAISLDEGGWSAIEPFVAEREIQYQVALGDQEAFASFDGIGIPYTLVVDPHGTVKSLYRGPVGLEELQRDVDLILGTSAEDSAS